MAEISIQSILYPRSRPSEAAKGVEGEVPNRRCSEVAQRVFLGMAAVCAILSLIPPLRLGAAFALRGVSFLSTALPTQDERGVLPVAMKAVKISAIALGIVGLAASMPILLIGSLAIDMGLQTAALVRSVIRKEPQAAVHLTLLVVDTLALLAFVFASWQLLVAATAVNAFAMLSMAIIAGAVLEQPDACLSFLALGAASLASSFMIPPKSKVLREVTIENKTPDQQILVEEPLGGRGVIGLSEPGKNITVTNRKGLFRAFYITYISANGRSRQERFRIPMEMVKQPMAPSLFGTVPIGGPAIAAIESHKWPRPVLQN